FVEDGLSGPEKMRLNPGWYGWDAALDGMAELTTVCIYGRRGVGGTDPLAEGSVRTTSDQVDDLQSLWSTLGVAAPVVLVGHSVAGFNLRVAADRSADDVAGLVFVDASTPGAEEFMPTLPPPGASEWLDLSASGQQVAATADVGDLPVYVITGGTEFAPDWWDALQVELAAISTNSQHVTLPESGHMVHMEDPQAIVDGLAWILQQIG
ncbi:MAG: alpha/beta hydrolase, partial [Actinomycetia bacterium]|nr:alpha/beta hydrolase [Actinomycetes bacterium]